MIFDILIIGRQIYKIYTNIQTGEPSVLSVKKDNYIP